MNREVLFRGKAIAGFHTGKFVYGYLVKDYWHQGDCGIHPIDKTQGGYIEVNPETAGQYTGLTDKNGKKIFEGDIIKYPYHANNDIIAFKNGAFGYTNTRFDYFCSFDDCEYGIATDLAEVIGNIHDTPELLNDNC